MPENINLNSVQSQYISKLSCWFETKKACISASLLVGIPGFEPGTPCSQSRCANRTALHPEKKDISFILEGANIQIFLINQYLKRKKYCPKSDLS